jgi:thiamine biosynthesis lipoprotein ApbE/Na+-translocating ferredoxin:NAD+ oxidoreductase RnfG subunit/polyferredoxin
MPSPRVSAWLVKGWRLAALFLAALLLQRTTPLTESALTRLGLDDAKAFFPDAKRLKSGPNQTLLVQDEHGNRLGRLVTTAPDADSILGYAGPSNVLVALDIHEKIVGTRILSSEDTPEHVDALRKQSAFEKSFKEWRPTTQPTPKLEAYAGSTLTAYAIAESIQKRLSGNYVSLRFATPLSLKEIQSVGFPDAASFEPNVPRLGWNLVRGPNRAHLGFVVRSSPSADEVIGYAGPSETLIAVESDGLRLRQVLLRTTYDTEEYVSRIKDQEPDPQGRTFFKDLTKWNTREWAEFDFRKGELDTVAGATLTSYAIAKGLQTRFGDDAHGGRREKQDAWQKLRTGALWCFLVGALLMTFTSWHGRPIVRTLWQILLVGGLGLWLGQLLSLSLFAGWARHGIPWAQAPALLFLGAVALLVPWGARRQLYCHHVCPHGAAQELLGGFKRLHVAVPGRWHVWLGKLPAIALAGAFLAALMWPRWNIGQVEPFDAWILGIGVAIPLTLAVVGLLASVAVPQAYCKYGCPTGALFKFVRSANQAETWGRRDTWAASILAVGAVVAFIPRPDFAEEASPETSARQAVTELHGAAFGTTWTVKVRGSDVDAEILKRELEAEINRVEFSLSHWRESSATADFNHLESTQPFGISQELAETVEFALKLSAASDGMYDITVAPLTNLWGYGPAGKLPDPTVEQLKVALAKVGWQKLRLDKENLTLAKSHEGLNLDLGSVLQGFAADRAAAILRAQGQHDFLIEVGGEILAAGSWRVGIEDPFNPRLMLQTMLLTDRALSPSGLYRAKKLAAGKPVSHILSPKTGRPVEPTLEMAVVTHDSCFQADGWSTALMAAGFEQAKRIAQREKLDVILVTPDKKVWRSGK